MKSPGLISVLLVLLLGVVVLFLWDQDQESQASILQGSEQAIPLEEGRAALLEEEGELQASGRISLVDEATVHAQGKGGAAFHFVDSEGGGVEGIAIQVFPGALEGPTDEEPHGVDPARERSLTEVSDPEGLARFSDLVPGEYRWSLNRVGSVFSRYSGELAIAAGATAAETIVVGTGTLVVGRVPVFSPLERAHLRLFKKRGGMNSEEPAGGIYASPDGSFSIPCTPGPGYISAFWPEVSYSAGGNVLPEGSGTLYHLAGQAVGIEEGLNDVGTLRISENQLRVRVLFELDGGRIERAQLFEEGSLRAVLNIDSLNDPAFGEMAWVSIDEEIRVKGLWDGEWFVSLLPRPRFPLTRAGFLIPSQEPMQVFMSTSAGEEIELVYKVSRPVETQFHIVWAGEPFQAEVLLLPKGGTTQDLQAFDTRSDEVVTLGLSRGTYDYLVLPHYAAGERANASSSGTLEIEGGSIFIDAKPGVTLEGRSKSGQRIKATIKGWEGIYPFRLNAEEDGRWEISGIPLDSTVLFSEGGEFYTGNSPERRFTF